MMMSKRRAEEAQLRNLESAMERGVITEREYDDELDAFIKEQNRKSEEHREVSA
jgi:hypothetical protein